jgi:hypothetical protein
MLKINTTDIVTKALSTILLAAITGTCTLFYNEYQTYQEVKKLLKDKEVLEAKFTENVEELQRDNKKLNKRLESYIKKDSVSTDYSKKWVDYWRGI